MTETDTFATAKQTMRERMRTVRARISPEAAAEAAERLAANGMEMLERAGDGIIAGYAPMPSEIDALPLMRRLAKAGRSLCLPVVEAAGLPLTFRRWVPGEPLEKGRMGVRVPAATSALVTPQIVLVPLLAFDRQGYRLGLGAGFYDRTLENLRASGDVSAIGVAFDEQAVEAVPHEGHDQRLDAIITPSAIIGIEP